MKVTLSARQEQCLKLLVKLYDMGEIGLLLGIKYRTVRQHIRRAADKFGIGSLKGEGHLELLRIAKAYFSFVRGQPAVSPSAGTSPASPVAPGLSAGDV